MGISNYIPALYCLLTILLIISFYFIHKKKYGNTLTWIIIGSWLFASLVFAFKLFEFSNSFITAQNFLGIFCCILVIGSSSYSVYFTK